MSWLRVGDEAADHPAVLAAGDGAFGTAVRMALWSSRHLTDGAIPAAAARTIGTRALRARCVKAGLLVADGDGDFRLSAMGATLLHVRPAEEVLAERAVRAKAGRAGGIRSGAVRRGEASAEAGAEATASRLASGKSEPPSRPDPVPKRERDAAGAAPSLVSAAPERTADPDPLGKPENAKQRQVVQRWRAQAVQVLEAVSAARQRVSTSARSLSASYSSLAEIAGRLDAGKTVEECLHVVAVFEAESKAKPETFTYFNSISPFRPTNFERIVAKDVATVQAAATSERHGYGAPPADTRPLPPVFTPDNRPLAPPPSAARMKDDIEALKKKSLGRP